MLAFKVLDADESGSLSLKEFKSLVKIYQFKAVYVTYRGGVPGAPQ